MRWTISVKTQLQIPPGQSTAMSAFSPPFELGGLAEPRLPQGKAIVPLIRAHSHLSQSPLRFSHKQQPLHKTSPLPQSPAPHPPSVPGAQERRPGLSLHLYGGSPVPGVTSFQALVPAVPAPTWPGTRGAHRGAAAVPSGVCRAGQELPGLSLQPPLWGSGGSRLWREGRTQECKAGDPGGLKPSRRGGSNLPTPSCLSRNPDSCHSWGCLSSAFRIIRQSRTKPLPESGQPARHHAWALIRKSVLATQNEIADSVTGIPCRK